MHIQCLSALSVTTKLLTVKVIVDEALRLDDSLIYQFTQMLYASCRCRSRR